MVKVGHARREGARILSASVIGLSALALVGGVAYVQFNQPEDSTPLQIRQENPTPPPDVAQNEAARNSAEKRLAEAMAIQITNLPSATAPKPAERIAPEAVLPSKPAPAAPLVVARADVAPPPSPPGMPVAEQEALLNRVTGLLKQGDVGAARAVLNRLVRENNAKAAFVLAQSYDPVVLRQGRVVGMRADAELARSLYNQALRGGVTEAKAALDTLAAE